MLFRVSGRRPAGPGASLHPYPPHRLLPFPLDLRVGPDTHCRRAGAGTDRRTRAARPGMTTLPGSGCSWRVARPMAQPPFPSQTRNLSRDVAHAFNGAISESLAELQPACAVTAYGAVSSSHNSLHPGDVGAARHGGHAAPSRRRLCSSAQVRTLTVAAVTLLRVHAASGGAPQGPHRQTCDTLIFTHLHRASRV